MLAAKDPTNAASQADVAASHDTIGDVCRSQGDHAGAITEYRASVAILEPLVAKDPTNADRQWYLAAMQNKVGEDPGGTAPGRAASTRRRSPSPGACKPRIPRTPTPGSWSTRSPRR